MRKIMILLLLLPFLLTNTAYAKGKVGFKEANRYEVVEEYIRSLGEIHRIQMKAKSEKTDDRKYLLDAIGFCKSLNLQLSRSIYNLKDKKLKKPFNTLIPNTIFVYREKIKLYEESVSIAKIFLRASPKPGIDYVKYSARMPEITAENEFLDQSLFESMVLVCLMLIDEKPDGDGNMSHLIITKEQRQTLISNIDGYFGDSLDAKDKNYIVGSAALLKAFLSKDYKCIDDWQQQQ